MRRMDEIIKAVAGAIRALGPSNRLKKAKMINNHKVDMAVLDIKMETMRAKSLHPSDFVNAHEAYAVLLEEVDELWEEIKKKQSNYDLEAMRKEAVQVGAMAVRLISELL